MAFMERQIEFGQWIDIDGDNGTTFVPCDVVGTLPIPDAGHEWASTEASPNYHDDSDRTESVHIKSINGSSLHPTDLFRVFRLAGLIAR